MPAYFKPDGTGPTTLQGIRNVFYHPLQSVGMSPAVIWPLHLKQIRIDEVDFHNLSPVLAAALERIPGRNFKLEDVWIARGCGHPMPVNCPSALCGTCIIQNSQTSGHDSTSLVTIEKFVFEYCQQFEPSFLDMGKAIGNVRRWKDILNGFTDPLPSAFNGTHGLADTARERIVASELALRARLLFSNKLLQQPQVDGKRLENITKKAEEYAAELRSAIDARLILSTAIRDPTCEHRIRRALNAQWSSVAGDYVPFERKSIGCVDLLRKINPRRYRKRKKAAEEAGDDFPDPYLPMQVSNKLNNIPRFSILNSTVLCVEFCIAIQRK